MSATAIVHKESIPTNVGLFSLPISATPLINWPGLEEVDTSMPWHNADLVATQRMATAKAFAADVLTLPQVESLWICEVANDFKVCVVVSEVDLDFDLTLRERFIALASQRLGPGEGDLFVYKRDIAPDWVFQGSRVIA